jgi:hypothetical protein
MIIFTGLGFLAVLLPIFIYTGTQYVVNAIMGNNMYFTENAWPKFVGVLIGGIVVWFLGKHLNKNKAQVLIDKETGKEVVLKKTHTLFFIPMEYWGPIVILIGLITAFTPL